MRAGLKRHLRAKRLPVAALLWAVLLPHLVAQTLTGTVGAAGKPLEDAVVAAEANGRGFGNTRTDAQGRFSIPLAPAGSARDYAVTFGKAGFRDEVRRLDRNAVGRPLQVILLANSGPSAISAQDEAKLRPLITTSGTGPLMFVPYALPAAGSGVPAADANQRLRVQLQRLIVTHVQSTVGRAEVSITPLPVDADNDIARLQAIGEFVNALGVVSGMGLGDISGQSLELSSSFVIIPRPNLFSPPVLNIIDTVPASKIGLSALDQRFSRSWGRATVLALAARDLKATEALSGAARVNELRRVRAYLVSERSSVGPADELGAARLKEVIDRVTQEVGP